MTCPAHVDKSRSLWIRHYTSARKTKRAFLGTETGEPKKSMGNFKRLTFFSHIGATKKLQFCLVKVIFSKTKEIHRKIFVQNGLIPSFKKTCGSQEASPKTGPEKNQVDHRIQQHHAIDFSRKKMSP